MKYCRSGALLVCAGAVLCLAWATGQDAAWAVNKNLAVNSLPASGINISLSVDGGAPGNITTNFSQPYERGTSIALTAPATFNHRDFIEWRHNGSTYSTELAIEFSLDQDEIYVAVYSAPKVKLQVTSSPDTGIDFLNEDITILTTPYERNFEQETPYEAIINAPIAFNGKPFSRWLKNGKEVSTLHVINVIMDDNYSLEAQYGSGSITCKIQPKEARKQARWRIDGGEWLKRGTTVTGLRIGDHILEWKPVPGFTTPNKRKVPVKDGDALTIRGRYFPLK